MVSWSTQNNKESYSVDGTELRTLGAAGGEVETTRDVRSFSTGGDQDSEHSWLHPPQPTL